MDAAPAAAAAADPLPSWNEGAAKSAILAFLGAAADPASPGYVQPSDRIAAFDNDGTLWPEQPMYTQLAFALDRAKALNPSRPEWAGREPFESAVAGDAASLAAQGLRGVAELVGATHAGMTSSEFESIVRGWVSEAVHPRFGKRYTELAYAPMLEVLAALRAAKFAVYIVTGGGAEFVRPWAGDVYGIPPENVIGSEIELEYADEYESDSNATAAGAAGTAAGGARGPALVRKPKVARVCDGPVKPAAIAARLGRPPAAAFGNSDGDFEMLRWTTAAAAGGGGGGGCASSSSAAGASATGGAAAPSAAAPTRLGVVVRHTDGTREYAYDRESHFGKLSRALDAADANGWVVVDMARDWRRVFAFE